MNFLPRAESSCPLSVLQRVRIIEGFFWRKCMRILSLHRFDCIEKIISCLFVFLAYHICPLILKLQNASDTHSPCKFLTDNNARWTIDEFIGFLPGEEYIIEVTMQIKITGENVKFIGNRSFQESFVNMSLHT